MLNNTQGQNATVRRPFYQAAADGRTSSVFSGSLIDKHEGKTRRESETKHTRALLNH